MGLVRSAVRHYCLGGCSALFGCARRSRQDLGGRAGASSSSPPLLFPPSLALPAVLVVDCPVWVSLSSACWYNIPCGLCVLRAGSGCPSDPRRVLVACVCAYAPAVYALCPLVAVARAPRAVPLQGAGRVIPCGSCISAFPSLLQCPH